MLRVFMLFVMASFRQKHEPHYCTNLFEHINEDITKNNITIPSSTLEKLLALKRRKRITKHGGFDDRNISEDDSLSRIAENIRKYNLLKLLEHGGLGDVQKLEALKEWQKIDGESPIAPDLTKGGLFREWEWDF